MTLTIHCSENVGMGLEETQMGRIYMRDLKKRNIVQSSASYRELVKYFT